MRLSDGLNAQAKVQELQRDPKLQAVRKAQQVGDTIPFPWDMKSACWHALARELQRDLRGHGSHRAQRVFARPREQRGSCNARRRGSGRGATTRTASRGGDSGDDEPPPPALRRWRLRCDNSTGPQGAS
jgi:hypothetical protein